MSDEFEGVFKDEDSPNDLFNEATIYVRKKTSEISKENLLYLYGRYKYAHEGPCNTSRPGGILNLEAKSKWDSWNSVEKNLTKEKAKEQYIAKLDGLFPKWKDTTDSKKISDQFSKADQAGTFGNKTSTMTKEIIKDSDKNCFDLCREGLVDKLKDYLVNNPNSVDQTDENDMTMSMWACDRGHLDILKLLVEKGADLNKQDSDGQTVLHYSCSNEQIDIVKYLIQTKKVNKDIKDNEGSKAIETTENKEIIQILNL